MEGEQIQVVVKHHVHIYVQIYRNKIVSRGIYSDEMSSAQHNLSVVNKEASEHQDSVVRVNGQE